ncbi:MAG: hypothetical protein ACXADB_13170 [Candidatus Hermodarchaeia archaeon]|jgi:hypothetical protein
MIHPELVLLIRQKELSNADGISPLEGGGRKNKGDSRAQSSAALNAAILATVRDPLLLQEFTAFCA